jgi:hypothetical protein
MAYLQEDELVTMYSKAANITDRAIYLARANAYCEGKIGGPIPALGVDGQTIDLGNLKTAVVMAFELFAKDETGQADPDTGNITDAAPAGYFSRSNNPFKQVDEMLVPYAQAVDATVPQKSERGIRFL